MLCLNERAAFTVQNFSAIETILFLHRGPKFESFHQEHEAIKLIRSFLHVLLRLEFFKSIPRGRDRF